MRFKLFVPPLLALSIFALAVPASCQVVPTYQRQGLPIMAGLGFSGYNVDWGHGAMYGGTFWLDWYPTQLPALLHGLGLEAEARDISLHQSSTQTNVRQDTASGGPIYAWRHWESFHPYGKFLYGHGSMDFPPHGLSYSHDTRSFWAVGGGFEYRFHGPFWSRVDYEHQTWQQLFGYYSPMPQGITVGVSYDFAHPRFPK